MTEALRATVGHRALVVYERPDGRYDRHYAHWGAADLELRHGITPETPFAGNRPSRIGERWTPAIDPTPRDTALAFEDAATFDYRAFEAFYVVSLTWLVAAYLPLWFGATADADVHAGALVAVESERDAARVRRWFRATRDVVRDMVRRDVLDVEDAHDYLASRVGEWAGSRREVISVR
ncbi:hypothetical protein BG842_13825 [Haladaptatus sp. W1]|uniref:DUF6735 family protein n=2 Tax=Haladaptatus sp. W1 TaxID=1897478 RepID=UPI000849C2CC|nr:DUF6735 family protein [Haladaptatus sp. W1]ODR79618.1 hypothetical protein BG842_13825 [Haladaptatus sp. W1]